MLRTSETPRDSIPGRFRCQVVLAVGGAQGIGKAIATRLAKEGARLVIGDIDRKMMTQPAGEIAAGGGSVRTVVCDVRQQPQVNRMAESTVRWYRREVLGLDH